jgi:hypothetical protein
VLVPRIHICRSRSQNNDAMLDGLDHALRHPVALRPLGCSALVLDGIILTHHIKLCSPLPSIVSKYEFGNPMPTDYFIFQKPGCCFSSMISNRLCFAPLRIVVNSVATLTWPSVGVKPNTWKELGFGVLRDSRMFRAR